MSKCKPLTNTETAWINDFKKLAKRCPKKLWLFSASGSLRVMKSPDDNNELTDSGGVNPENSVAIIQIANDGGDW